MTQAARSIERHTAPEAPPVPSVDGLTPEQLEQMAAAGREVMECHRVLRKGGLNIVGELLRAQGTFYEMRHYPKGDVYDNDTHSQYYYHAHRKGSGEHGHFHTFLRAAGMPKGIEPAPQCQAERRPLGKDALSHLISISMDRHGYAMGLFAVNRWVTGETWYQAEDVIRMLDHFAIDHARPSWPTNRWISAMFRLFRPHIEALVWHRDDVIRAHMERNPERDVFEDRALEITGYLSVSVETQIAAINKALAGMTPG